jgi:hypothetical protein
MHTYLIIPEADGSYSVHVDRIGSLPGRYTGFKSKDEADQWVAEHRNRPDLPPFFDRGFSGI